MKKYFVRKNNEYLWEDGKFYQGFTKSPYAVDEEVAKHYEKLGCEIEYAEPTNFPLIYGNEEKKPRRTYVRCSGFALAEVLDRLCDSESTYNVWVSLEDSDFLVSFEFHRKHERKIYNSEPSVCLPQNGESK